MKKDFMAVLTARPSEVVQIEGIDFEVRGISLKEARELQKKYDGKDGGDIALIVASVFVDGEPAFSMETIGDVMPLFLKQFDAAIGRINQGPELGNSNATVNASSASG